MANGLYETKRTIAVAHVRDNSWEKSSMVKMERHYWIYLYVEDRANKAFRWIGKKLGGKKTESRIII